MEEFKTTLYIRLLYQGDATNEELEEALGDFTHRIYEFCIKEKNVTFIYFSLHHLRTLLIHIEDMRTETGGKLSANGGIAFWMQPSNGQRVIHKGTKVKRRRKREKKQCRRLYGRER